MIKTSQNPSEIAQALATDFITDKQPLVDYAGFDPNCEFAAQARQTFTLPLPSSAIESIHSSIGVLYKQLISACWKKDEALPFDMVRFDAFLDPADNSLKIIELNTRNVGLHEIVEWLDDITSSQLSASQTPSLNHLFVGNQKIIHKSLFGDDAPLLYMSMPMIPKWIYYEELKSAYSSVCAVENQDECKVTATGITFNETEYHAITRKFSWPASSDVKQLDDDGVIRILQPRDMRLFGYKDYLPKFDSAFSLQSFKFKAEDINDYVARKNELVLKIINGGASYSVYLGPSCSEQEWRNYLLIASQKPSLWVVQQYLNPPEYEIFAHGLGPRQARIQLGIFVLPNPTSPADFTIDIVVKAYTGNEQHFTFDPSGLHPEIWFGNILEVKS